MMWVTDTFVGLIAGALDGTLVRTCPAWAAVGVSEYVVACPASGRVWTDGCVCAERFALPA